eukprot:gnl/TRDRNA2_/TRDRNA2_144616_c1_seq2.p2 gnl/TRDRNA2_/TRDRNA2_144616_c1~~gnl/TRDRNA2_/TRDRNA2_144616_c1_seq2.p2  ORF type:complete len:104 (+),score=1.58 gnl/TRDRNA2_/TRDRNA2_144616_c1_seq2:143-454(+)
MAPSCGDLCVSQAFIRSRNVALSVLVGTTSKSCPIASKQHCMARSCRDLLVKQPFAQSRKTALSVIVVATCYSHPVAPKQNCMEASCGNHSYEGTGAGYIVAF